MKHFRTKQLNFRKAARFAIAINVMQVLAIVGVIAYVLSSGRASERYVELGVLALALVIITWGALLDIREAMDAQRTAEQAAMLEDAYAQLEALNDTLRKQRHDFKNHLQVVYSLMELDEFDEATRYIESVYGDIRKTGSALRTAIPAVNALIAAKRADCAEHGIVFSVGIRSAWQDLPVQGWEMCRVLGNLIDNARDALADASGVRTLSLDIDETPGAFIFRVSNNGPAIDPEQLEVIFRMGFTTKRDGSGAGLAIVKEILEAHGGSIRAESDDRLTVFSGTIPRTDPHKSSS
ncbi:MAG: Spo0B domain-containing protein [Clostridia bacterium]|nr:Spo0B domain-containing protein [Clostridia bacterium]